MSTTARLASAVVVLCCSVARIEAQQPSVPSSHPSASDTVQFFSGAALGLGLHESGHLVFDLAFDASPGVRKVSAGFIPFFAITHEPVSPVREFAISSAGFWVQHATSEVLLTRRPALRYEHAPIAKGLLAFNVVTSVLYAGAAFVQRGPLERDSRGMALAARLPEPWIGVSIIAPATFDAARYYQPHSRWLPWASRASKVAGALLVVKAAE